MENKLEIKIINKSRHKSPQYSTKGSSGMDLRANLEDPENQLILAPGARTIVPCGIFLEIPEGYEAQIRPRSGLAANHGITVLNTPGTIDSSYRGEIKVILYNSSPEYFPIFDGDRIAQMVFTKVEEAVLIESQELTQTERNEGGLGHTGIK
jgi:dUTP pyrophosphatase